MRDLLAPDVRALDGGCLQLKRNVGVGSFNMYFKGPTSPLYLVEGSRWQVVSMVQPYNSITDMIVVYRVWKWVEKRSK
jgi:hypothetical protein